jgi:serine/threonine protein kinase
VEGIADYRFTEELGAGNHGRYFLAVAPERLGLDGARVAVKVLDRRASESDFKRVANELRVFHAVESDHLVEVQDAGYADGVLFYAMRYYPDGSLERPERELSERERVLLVAGAARGAHDLHEVGVVHRDVKPANILIDGDRARLTDLGLARLLSPGMTSTGIGPIGSIEFMSPQAILGERASRATDVWALGVTLHRVLTGEAIYGSIPDGNVMEAFTHVLRTTPEVSERLPAPYRPVVERCLRQGLAFATAADLADELEAIASPA